ncbi:ribosomal protein RPL24 [Toxoplasma gondii CAST]|uniref:Large ribosomal subunit protein uL24c n=1 Tax=Toxoplasma gondii CAST TaxID=943122 RepID=A0A3R8AXI8_TOXGO|nr:ribosomal protein RPL24 [Toxoplasma gondii CAST]
MEVFPSIRRGLGARASSLLSASTVSPLTPEFVSPSQKVEAFTLSHAKFLFSSFPISSSVASPMFPSLSAATCGSPPRGKLSFSSSASRHDSSPQRGRTTTDSLPSFSPFFSSSVFPPRSSACLLTPAASPVPRRPSPRPLCSFPSCLSGCLPSRASPLFLSPAFLRASSDDLPPVSASRLASPASLAFRDLERVSPPPSSGNASLAVWAAEACSGGRDSRRGLGWTYTADSTLPQGLFEAARFACQRRGMKFVHPRHWILQWKIRPGDKVVVISGKFKTIRGTVLQIDKMRNGVSVSGVKEQKRVKQEDGSFIRIPGLIHVSNVMLIDQAIDLPTRVALRVDDRGNVVRISKKSGLVIPWPDGEMIKFGDNRKSREFLKSKEERDVELRKEQNDDEERAGPKDTPAEVAVERTYDYQRDVATMQALRQMMTKYNRDFR